MQSRDYEIIFKDVHWRIKVFRATLLMITLEHFLPIVKYMI